MKKTLKYLSFDLLITVLTVFGVANYANATALTWSADYTIDLSAPDVNLTIISGSSATSLIVGTENIQVIVPEGITFTVTSVSRGLNVIGDTTSGISNTCSNANVATVVIIGGDAGETITVAPTTSACEEGGGGGGGGGSSTSATTTPITTLTTTPTTPTATLAYNFGTTVLKNGSTGEAVKELQRFLNATMNLGLVVDGMFGPHTTTVMKQWQTAHNLVSDGLVGLMTKAAMLASLGAVAPVITPAVTASYNFGTTVLKNGSTGEAVKELQRFLNATMNLGLVVDGMFGPHTTTVMKQWQTAHNLVSDGLVGLMTKAAMLASLQ